MLWLQLYRPFRATAQDMCRFHTEDYINFLQGVTPQSVHEYTKNLSVFNVGDDWWDLHSTVSHYLNKLQGRWRNSTKKWSVSPW